MSAQESPSGLWHRKTTVIAALSIGGILSHLVLRFGFHTTAGIYQMPLLATLVVGGLPLLYDLLRKLLKREFGSDLGWHFHHYLHPAGRISGGLDHRPDAFRR